MEQTIVNSNMQDNEKLEKSRVPSRHLLSNGAELRPKILRYLRLTPGCLGNCHVTNALGFTLIFLCFYLSPYKLKTPFLLDLSFWNMQELGCDLV